MESNNEQNIYYYFCCESHSFIPSFISQVVRTVAVEQRYCGEWTARLRENKYTGSRRKIHIRKRISFAMEQSNYVWKLGH